jgi:fumarate reductase flavoprotein subunit
MVKRFSVSFTIVLLTTTILFTGCQNGNGGNGDGDSGLSYSADVIIVGAGGAGLSAAITARNAGVSVILLEKSAVLGGNTLPASAGLTAVETDEQKEAGNNKTLQDYITDHTNDLNKDNLGLVTIMAEKSKELVEWLKSMGLKFTVRQNSHVLAAPGGSIGAYLIPTLAANAEGSGAKIFFETAATELITEGGRVTGVKAVDNVTGELLTFKGTVLLTTGGFGRDNAMVAKYAPRYAGISTDEIAPTTGDGIKMAEKLGAATVDMDQFQTFPMVEVNSHDMMAPPMIAEGAIFVDYEGKRFGPEDQTMGYGQTVIDTLLDNYPPDKKQYYYVFGEKQATTALLAYKNRGVLVEEQTLGAVAERLGFDSAIFTETVENWNMVIDGETDELGRTGRIGSKKIEAPYYVLRVGVGLHYCRGGLKIDTQTRVLKTDGTVIGGLYAAGEVTGGVHGNFRVDGSGVTDSLLFGRFAAQEAAAYARELKANAAAKGPYTDGVHEGKAWGRNGEIVVAVTVINGTIARIEIVSDSETPTMKDSVERVTIPSIINTQSTDGVDTVSGATFTYIGLLNAVKNALDA